jgi:hypothetical protein
VVTEGLKDSSGKMATDLHLSPRLRMNGAILPFLTYAFTAHTGVSLLLFYMVRENLETDYIEM